MKSRSAASAKRSTRREAQRTSPISPTWLIAIQSGDTGCRAAAEASATATRSFTAGSFYRAPPATLTGMPEPNSLRLALAPSTPQSTAVRCGS